MKVASSSKMVRVRGALVALLLPVVIFASSQARAFAPRDSWTLGPARVSATEPAARRGLPLLEGRPANAPLLYAKLQKFRKPGDTDTVASRPSLKYQIRSAVRAFTHRPKEVDAATAAALIKAGDRVFVPVGLPTSNLILGALADRAKSPTGGLTPEKPVEIVGLLNSASRSLFDRAGNIVPRALFIGGNSRDAVAAGRGSFVPAYFGRVPRLIREGKVPVDITVVQVSPPDKRGFVTLGPTAADTLAALEKSRVVIAQVNGEVPVTYGATRVHVSQLDYVVRRDEPLPCVPPAEITEVDRKIAQNVVKLVVSSYSRMRPMLGRATLTASQSEVCGAIPTFQFGIGGIPDAVAQELAATPRLKGCRIRSELIGPGTRCLVESGKVQGKVQYTFAMGDQGFLRWMSHNARLVAGAVDVINDPARIGRIPRMVAINSALRVDLNGQINAQQIKGEWYSGVGGQVDFMRGAMLSQDGKAIIALPSVAEVSDGQGGKRRISKIVPRLGEDDVVTTNMHDVQYVVTEHGVAALEGKSDVERARALIAIAHPDFRAELTTALEQQIARRSAAESERYERFMTSQSRK